MAIRTEGRCRRLANYVATIPGLLIVLEARRRRKKKIQKR